MRKITNYKKRIKGIIGLLISIILVICFSDISAFLVDFCEKYLSSDNYLEPYSVFKIIAFLIILILLITTISMVFILDIVEKTRLFSDYFFQTNKLIKFFLTDNLCSVKRLPNFIFAIGTMSSFFLHFYVISFSYIPPEGNIEALSSLFLLFSALILMISITKINSKYFSAGTRKRIAFSLIIISGIVLLILGEEISWGQRIFNWDSPGIITKYNFQNETNIHNLFNPILDYLYPLFGMSLFIILIIIWFFPNKGNTYLFELFSPQPSLFFLVFIMAGSTFYGHSETFETLFAMFILLYSFRIFMCLSYPKMNIYSKDKYLF